MNLAAEPDMCTVVANEFLRRLANEKLWGGNVRRQTVTRLAEALTRDGVQPDDKHAISAAVLGCLIGRGRL